MTKPTARRPRESKPFGAERPYRNTPRHDYFLALAAARKATRRGDFKEADKWMKLAERHLMLEERQVRLDDARTARRMSYDEEVGLRRWSARESFEFDGMTPSEAMRDARRMMAGKTDTAAPLTSAPPAPSRPTG